ncbi:MAG TPA: OsmC family protein [Phycisphaerae bacterium]
MSDKIHHYEIRILWTGAADGGFDYKTYPRAHEIKLLPNGPTISASADPAYLGDPSRANPEQLLVAALSSCQMLSFLALAARAGVVVTRYEDRAEGTMQIQDRKVRITHVVLHPQIRLGANTDREKAERLVHEAHELCFIANSVRCEVAVKPEFAWR